MLMSAKISVETSLETSDSKEKLLYKFRNQNIKTPSELVLEERILFCMLGKKGISKAFIWPIKHTGKLLSYGHRVCLGVE